MKVKVSKGLLESFNEKENGESVSTMLASEDVLNKEWDNEFDMRWRM